MHPVLLLVHIIPLSQYMLGSALQFLVLTAETLFIYLFIFIEEQRSNTSRDSVGSHGINYAVICRLEEIPCIEAARILKQQMLPVSCGVEWNQSLCYWRCPGAVLCCVSGEWIKCPFLVPWSRVKFNFRAITDSPCANTPAAANVELLLSFTACLFWSSLLVHVLPLLAFSKIWKSEASSLLSYVVSPLSLDQLTKQINTSAVYLLSRILGFSLPCCHDQQLNSDTVDYSFITGRGWTHSYDRSPLKSTTNSHHPQSAAPDCVFLLKAIIRQRFSFRWRIIDLAHVRSLAGQYVFDQNNLLSKNFKVLHRLSCVAVLQDRVD